MSNKIKLEIKKGFLKTNNAYKFDTNKLKLINDDIYLYTKNADDYMHPTGIIFSAVTTLQMTTFNIYLAYKKNS